MVNRQRSSVFHRTQIRHVEGIFNRPTEYILSRDVVVDW